MNDDRIDVAALRGALEWTQQQLADYCDTDRSTVSKWESEPPTKGPALILLRQLRDRTSLPAADAAVPAEPVAGAQPERAAASDIDDFDAALPRPNARGAGAGPVRSSQAGTGLQFQTIQETAK
ncbi:helix-turn-helix domain-containing protein [Mesorhizobium sp. GbtcB19]|uniref:helix-turn-helix domain-containing protein n=1 Tax=Mesorhizobium sp. GbtcB19 TaxID=2824764 RepID=UPI001C2F884E|nr:helix-turn-helix domain-containing protein [Mesorhizobium sp. GbtcB19]